MLRVFVAVGALLFSVAAPAAAAPVAVAHIVHIHRISSTWDAVFIASPAMQRVVEVDLVHPVGDAPRPTFYLLDGVDSPPGHSNWTQHTDIVRMFARHNANVVLPVGGRGSYYTDWERPDPTLGMQRWETFLTTELPPLVDSHLNGNGRNVIGGLSMGGTAAAVLITRHPALYRGVAIFSGCPDSVARDSKLAIRGAVMQQGGTPDNMWGPDTNPAWLDHDPMSRAEALRGKTIYLAVGSGIPGPKDTPQTDYPRHLALAMPLEYAAGICTQAFYIRLATLGIPATFVYHAIGTHSWPYWQDDLHEAWPTLADALDTY